MTSRIRRIITVLLLATGTATSLLAAEAPVVPRMTAPIAVDQKTARSLLVTPVVPEYPLVAKINYIQGKVFLQVLVSRAGTVRSAHVVKGDPILATSALKAIRQWRYRPFLTASGPTEFQSDVQVKFSLQGRKLKAVPPNPGQFLSRQVRLPEVLEKPVVTRPALPVRLRVLVNEEGRVVDAELISGQPSTFAEACQIVDRWKFRPARWGNIAIPWYVEVNVPGGASFLSSVGPESDGR
jgi:TonB family protein